MNDLVKKNEEFLKSIDDTGITGFENINPEMLKVPFLRIKRGTGEIFNSSSGTVYKNPIKMIFLGGTQHEWIEWEKGTLTKPPVNRYNEKDIETALASGVVVRPDAEKPYLLESISGNRLDENYHIFVMLPEYPEEGFMVLSFKRTTLKHFRQFINKAFGQTLVLNGNNYRAKLFQIVWSLKAESVKDDNGHDWFSFGDKKINAERVGTLIDPEYQSLQPLVKEAIQKISEMQFSKIDVSGLADTEEAPF